MPDFTDNMLPHINEHRLPGLDLGGDLIHPKYDGHSILNLPSSICQLLGAPLLAHPPLVDEILDPLGGGVRKVVLVLMDALALHRLQRWMAEEESLVWNRLAADGLLAPLTSITPSTTSAAITTLWTGQPPAAHGIGGYEQWLREYGVITNMIEHKPITYRGNGGNLKQAGFSPEDFLPVEPIGPHLRAHGIAPHAFQHYSIAHSGLSRMFMQAAEIHPFGTAVDLWISVRELLEAGKDQRAFIWAYWSNVDSLSHLHGPDDERPRAEFLYFSAALEEYFLNGLSPAAKKDTLLILMADHGQITTVKDPHYDLRSHPDFTRNLHMTPTGENRLAYLYIRPGQTEAVREYIERAWPGQFALVEPGYALEHGLFGPGPVYPRFPERLGDLIAIAKGSAYWWWGAAENPILGRHGGMSPEEMLVPFLAARL